MRLRNTLGTCTDNAEAGRPLQFIRRVYPSFGSFFGAFMNSPHPFVAADAQVDNAAIQALPCSRKV